MLSITDIYMLNDTTVLVETLVVSNQKYLWRLYNGVLLLDLGTSAKIPYLGRYLAEFDKHRVSVTADYLDLFQKDEKVRHWWHRTVTPII